MIHQTEIQFSQAVKLSEQVEAEREQEQAEAIEEFLSSYCDLFSGADFHYYAEKTGKPIEWIMSNAKYSDPSGSMGTT